jgi:hypothetical protein
LLLLLKFEIGILVNWGITVEKKYFFLDITHHRPSSVSFLTLIILTLMRVSAPRRNDRQSPRDCGSHITPPPRRLLLSCWNVRGIVRVDQSE